MANHTGQITNLVSRRCGSVSVSPSTAGTSTLFLDSVMDFHDLGGFVLVNGAAFAYSGRSVVNATLAMSAPLVADVARGSSVLVFPASVEKWAVVQGDSVMPEDAVLCRVPHNLASLLAADGQRDKDRQEKVEYTVSGNSYMLTNVLSKLPAITEDAIPDGLITETMILPGSITTPLIGANAVAAYHVQAAAIDTVNLTATAVDGMTITGALFRTDVAPNPRIEITTEGFLQYAVRDGVLQLVTQITADINKFTGSGEFDDIIVRDSLELYGQNNYFGPNSKVTLRTGVGGPGTPPTVNTTYKESTISSSLRNGFRVLFGYLKTPTDEYGYSEFFGQGEWHTGTNKHYPWDSIKITQSDGSLATRSKPIEYVRIETAAGARMVNIGEVKNTGHNPAVYPNLVAMVYDDSPCTSAGTVPPTETGPNKFLFAFSFNRSYGLGRFIDSAYPTAKSSYVWGSIDHPSGIDRLDAEVVYVQNNTTQSVLTSLSNINFAAYRVHVDEKLIGINYGSAAQFLMYVPGSGNPADQNVWIIHTTHQNIVLNFNATSRLTAIEWPVQAGGGMKCTAHGDIATNTFTEFGGVTFSNNYDQPPPMHKRYSNWSWYSTTVPHYFEFCWRGHSSKSPEWLTTPSPQSIKTPIKRAWTTVTVPSLPPPEAGVGGARDIDKDVYGWVLYSGLNSANASMWRQPISPSGDPTTVSEVDVVAGILQSGTNPVTTTQGFPSLSPAKIVSSASSGGNPLLEITGDGNIICNNVTVKGVVTGAKNVTDLAVVAVTGFTSATLLTRSGDMVDLYIFITSTGATAANIDTLTIPAAHIKRGGGNRYVWGLDFNTGAQLAGYLTGNSFRFTAAKTAGQQFIGHISYVAIP